MAQVGSQERQPYDAAPLPKPGEVEQKSKADFPWAGTALLVSGAALYTIGILSGIHVIHHVGTLSAQAITTASLTIGSTLMIGGAIILLRKHYEASKEERAEIPQIPHAYLMFQGFMSEGAAQKTQKSQVIQVKNTDNSNSIYEPPAEGNSVYKPCEYTFELNGESVTLYGLFHAYEDLDAIFRSYAEQLQETHGDIEQIKKLLSELDPDLILKMKDRVIVSASEYVKIEGPPNSEHRTYDENNDRYILTVSNGNQRRTSYSNDSKETFEVLLPETQGDLILFLGSPHAIGLLNDFDMGRQGEAAQRRSQDRGEPFLDKFFKNVINKAQGSSSFKKHEEFSLMVLELSK